jgi:MinD superfamily P-loop ATPase
MREVLIISGKGGTGKTSMVGAFAALAKNKVLADCDVDAANLYLLLNPRIKEEGKFYGSQLPVIDKEKCVECGRCKEHCRFDAIHDYEVEKLFCEGCLVCYYVCPVDAIHLTDRLSGNWFVSETVYGPLVHAKLGIAEENSGKLVAEVRRKARLIAETKKADLIITDGPPGIGCPVVSALSGVDLAVIVTEPTVAGLHDLDRVVRVAKHFGIDHVVCINKYDLDEEKTKEIENYCSSYQVEVAGKVSFSSLLTKAMLEGKSVVEAYPYSQVSREIERLWKRVKQKIVQ